MCCEGGGGTSVCEEGALVCVRAVREEGALVCVCCLCTPTLSVKWWLIAVSV